MSQEFAAQIAGVAVLAEPVRRELYLYVAAQPEPVSRDQASAGVGVARHTAKFHLDRLVEEGLLAADSRRVSGRRGPGAGRPAKLYRRSDRQVSVSLPERRYELAADLLARAIDDAGRRGVAVEDALHAAASSVGAALGEQVRLEVGGGAGPPLEAVLTRTLAEHGYEPREQAGTVTLVNCPFAALARDHTVLVCGMNLALLGGLAEQVGEDRVRARLEPGPDRCCVVLSTATG